MGGKKSKPTKELIPFQVNNQQYSFQNIQDFAVVTVKDLTKPKKQVPPIQSKAPIINNNTNNKNGSNPPIASNQHPQIVNNPNPPIVDNPIQAKEKVISPPLKAKITVLDEDAVFNTQGVIDEDGMIMIGDILGIDIYTHLFLPYFLFKSQAVALDQITKNEFNTGLKAFNVTTIKALKPKLNEYKYSISSTSFAAFYAYLFKINLVKNSKRIPLEVVEIYYLDLFSSYSYVKDFVAFLKDQKKVELTLDQWNCFLLLVKTYENKFPKGYTVDDSWPVLFDEFYYWYCGKHNIPVEKKRDSY